MESGMLVCFDRGFYSYDFYCKVTATGADVLFRMSKTVTLPVLKRLADDSYLSAIAPWVGPCPVGAEEINQRNAARQRKARMDARTRDRLPVLPVLVRTVAERHKNALPLLQAARQASPGKGFTMDGQTLTRATTHCPTFGGWCLILHRRRRQWEPAGASAQVRT